MQNLKVDCDAELLTNTTTLLPSDSDAELRQAAKDALTKILATLPERQQRQAMHAVNLVHRFSTPLASTIDMTLLREAMWTEEALDIGYKDRDDISTQRRIYPLAISYNDRAVMLLAWCCLRVDFRMFHVTRIEGYAQSGESFRPRRVSLLRDYIATLKARKMPSKY